MRGKIRTVEELSLAETNEIIDELERRLSSWLLEDDKSNELNQELVSDALPRLRPELLLDEVEKLI